MAILNLQLPRFISADFLPTDSEEISRVLKSPQIRKIICCALGPLGNNIEQACQKWLRNMKITNKTEVRLYYTPRICLAEARKIMESGVLAIFWTCAVYYELNCFFFENPDVLPFFVMITEPLDEMQLATREDNLRMFSQGVIPNGCKVASHPSPAPLLKGYPVLVTWANSNADAAQICARGEVDACITTEKARQLNNLVSIHVFGSPPMVFFGGITAHGVALIRSCMK